MKITLVDPTTVIVADRKRTLREKVMPGLMESIREIGVRQPIEVYRGKGGVALVSGLHRLEAARRLKLTEIPAVMFEDGDDIKRELVEIDENLMRAELTTAERAMHEKRRKELYEAIYPNSTSRERMRVGGRRGGKIRYGLTPPDEEVAPTYTEKAAKDRGAGRATITRDLARAEKLGGEIMELVKGSTLDKGLELDALVKLPPDERLVLAKRAAAGEKVSARPPKPKEHTCEYVCKHCGKPA